MASLDTIGTDDDQQLSKLNLNYVVSDLTLPSIILDYPRSLVSYRKSYCSKLIKLNLKVLTSLHHQL